MRILVTLILLLCTCYLCKAQKDSTNITGKWVEMLSKDKNHFIFQPDGYAIMSVAGDTVGGSPARNPRTKIYVRYQVSRNNKFFTLDLIKGRLQGNKEVEMSRLKGIFTYLSDGRLKFCLNFKPNDPRPEAFENGDTFIMTKQEP